MAYFGEKRKHFPAPDVEKLLRGGDFCETIEGGTFTVRGAPFAPAQLDQPTPVTLFPNAREAFGRAVDATFAQFVARCAQREIRADKDSFAIVGGDFAHGRRTGANARRLALLPLDIDSGGMSFAALLEKLEAFNRCAIAYTTFSHTPEKPKARVFFPLATPFEMGGGLASRADNAAPAPAVAARITEWAALVRGVVAALGVEVDPAAEKAAQLMFLPASPAGSAYEFGLIRGAFLDLSTVTPLHKPAAAKAVRPRAATPAQTAPVAAGANADPFAAAGAALGGRAVAVGAAPANGSSVVPTAPNGFDLKFFYSTAGQAFLAASAIRASVAPSGYRAVPGGGKVSIACPFEAAHSTPGGAGFFVADPADGRRFVASCMHAHCAERTAPEFLAKLLADGTLPASTLRADSPFWCDSG